MSFPDSSFASTVKLISKEKIPMIIGMETEAENKSLYLGMSPIYEGVKIGVDINSFFSNHFAIFGSTGRCFLAKWFKYIFNKTRKTKLY